MNLLSLFWKLVDRNSVKYIGNREIGRQRKDSKIITTNDLNLDIRSGKEGKRRLFYSTNDLDANRKIPENYLALRKQKEKKREKKRGGAVGIASVGIHDVWPT